MTSLYRACLNNDEEACRKIAEIQMLFRIGKMFFGASLEPYRFPPLEDVITRTDRGLLGDESILELRSNPGTVEEMEARTRVHSQLISDLISERSGTEDTSPVYSALTNPGFEREAAKEVRARLEATIDYLDDILE